MPAAFATLAAPPVFICGSARSGTTWTFDLFDRHPAVAAVCESWILSQTLGVTAVLSQPYWDLATKAAWEERVDMPFGAVQLLSYLDVVRDLSDLVGRWLMRAVSAEHRYLVAKEPLDVRATAILFPESRFVHVVRDGRNVALSMRHASETWDPSMGAGLSTGTRAMAWRRQVENVRDHRELLGDRYLEVKYEAVLRDKVGCLRAIFDFAGIPYDDSLLRQIDESTKLPSDDSMARTSGFRGGGQNRGWQEQLTLKEAFEFHRAAGDLLVELGYESSPRWWLDQVPSPRRTRA